MNSSRWSVLLGVMGTVAGCHDGDVADDAPRGAIAKADLFGSCKDSDCSGPSPDGTCYCDADCGDVGDCCTDKVEICDAECGAFAIEFEAAIGGGSGFSEVRVNALAATEGGAPQLLGTAEFLTAE